MRLELGGRVARVGAVVVVVAAALLSWSVVTAPTASAGVDLVSGTVTRAGFTVAAGDTLRFDPNVSTTLYVSGNLIMKGTLEMRPASPGIVHRLVFTGANESEFVGGGMVPLATDDGLWVVEGGRLDLSGAPREPWVRLAAGAAAGARTLTLAADPVGWRVGDQLRIAPTAPRQYREQFEGPTVAAISGRTVTLSAPLAYAHPPVTLPDGRAMNAEVLDLTRNVRIEGSPPAATFPRAAGANPVGRAHVFVNNTVPVRHTIDYVGLRYMGPRQFVASTGRSRFVMGRYALHFHMSGTNAAGTVVRGVVVTDSGSHAFVPHMSDGITFERDVTYNTAETPFWWDVKSNEETDLNNDPTNRTFFDRDVAANVTSDGGTSANRLAGFSLGCGAGNRITGSTAVGVQGGVQASGFFWPEGANSCGNRWEFTANIAHNNLVDGIFAWQNDSELHQVPGFVAYNNGGSGIDHGAYRNDFTFASATLFQNNQEPGGRAAEVTLHATAASSAALRFTGANVVTSSSGSHVVHILFHRRAAGPTQLDRWVVTGPAVDAVYLDEDLSPDFPGRVDFTCWSLRGGELEPADFNVVSMNAASVYRVQRRNGTAYQLLPDGTARTIPAFARCT